MICTILEIYEEDHGCEGIQPGEEQMDMAYIRDEAGQERWIRIPDDIGQHLKPGDRVEHS